MEDDSVRVWTCMQNRWHALCKRNDRPPGSRRSRTKRVRPTCAQARAQKKPDSSGHFLQRHTHMHAQTHAEVHRRGRASASPAPGSDEEDTTSSMSGSENEGEAAGGSGARCVLCVLCVRMCAVHVCLPVSVALTDNTPFLPASLRMCVSSSIRFAHLLKFHRSFHNDSSVTMPSKHLKPYDASSFTLPLPKIALRHSSSHLDRDADGPSTSAAPAADHPPPSQHAQNPQPARDHHHKRPKLADGTSMDLSILPGEGSSLTSSETCMEAEVVPGRDDSCTNPLSRVTSCAAVPD
eukprot:scaffold17075_cov19-Tisochrysis_lutea.AAC.2